MLVFADLQRGVAYRGVQLAERRVQFLFAVVFHRSSSTRLPRALECALFVPRRARAALFHDKTKRPPLHTRDIAHDYFHAVKVYAGKNNRHFTMPPVAPVLYGPRSIRFVSGAEENGRFQVVIVEIDRSAVEGDFEAMLIGRIGIAMRDLHSRLEEH